MRYSNNLSNICTALAKVQAEIKNPIFEYYEKISRVTGLDKRAYLVIAKLTAILRIANGLDRSHKQKFRNIKATLKEDELILMVDENVDITLERGLFFAKADFFEEVYSIRPVIHQKKTS